MLKKGSWRQTIQLETRPYSFGHCWGTRLGNTHGKHCWGQINSGPWHTPLATAGEHGWGQIHSGPSLQIRSRNFRNCSLQEIHGIAPLSGDMLIFDIRVCFFLAACLLLRKIACFASLSHGVLFLDARVYFLQRVFFLDSHSFVSIRVYSCLSVSILSCVFVCIRVYFLFRATTIV